MTQFKAFIAIEPAIDVVDRLVLLQEDLADPIRMLGGDVAWTRAEHVRLNLRVVDLEEGELGWVRDGLRTLATKTPSFDFEIAGARFLPSVTCARLVVVDAAAEPGTFERLREGVEGVVSRLTLPAEAHEWIPAIQVGRLRTGRDAPSLQGVDRPYSASAFGRTSCGDLVLATTQLSRGRVVQRLVERFPLAG